MLRPVAKGRQNGYGTAANCLPSTVSAQTAALSLFLQHIKRSHKKLRTLLHLRYRSKLLPQLRPSPKIHFISTNQT